MKSSSTLPHLNTNRLIVAAGFTAYVAAVLAVWWELEVDDRSWLIAVNVAYGTFLIVGSYVSDTIRREFSSLQTIGVFGPQIHSLYLLWLTELSPTLVIATFTLGLAPIVTFGQTFQRRLSLLTYLFGTAVAVTVIALTADTPQMSRAVAIIGFSALAIVIYLTTREQLTHFEDLRQNIQRQRALVDAIPDVMVRLSASNEVLDESLDSTTALGEHLRDTDLELSDVIERALDTGAMQTVERRLERSDGITNLEVRMIKSGEDEVTAIMRDVTHEKTMKARLMVTDRMAALGTLSVGIGHEINNPLTYVTMNLQYALEEVGGSDASPEQRETIVEALEDAVEGSERIRQIVEDLRRSIRLDEGVADVADLTNAIQFAVRVAGNQIRFKADLEVDIEEGLIVEGNEGRLAQVFLNLLVNASQSFDASATDARIEVSARAVGDQVVIEVRDNGCGIPPAIMSRIFDPFFTTKDVGQGTGLGLYVCHQIVTGCGGELVLDSAVDRGTTARVTLRPTHQATRQPRLEAEAAIRPSATSILVIDDEPRILRAFSMMMRGYEVTGCGEPGRGLDLILEGDYDAIFCDLMMPEMSGVELFEKVKKASPSKASRMVFITGGAFTESAHRFLEEHAESHLIKPFDRAAVVAQMNRPAIEARRSS